MHCPESPDQTVHLADHVGPKSLIAHLVQTIKEQQGGVTVEKVLNLFNSDRAPTAVEVAVVRKEVLQSSLRGTSPLRVESSRVVYDGPE